MIISLLPAQRKLAILFIYPVSTIPMSYTPELVALARCLAGEFSNQAQALESPVWYVNLRLWHRPLGGLLPTGITFFAEQANILKLDQPYRQRLLQLQEIAPNPSENQIKISVQYYKILTPEAFRGAGANPQLLENLTLDKIEVLPDCVLEVSILQTNLQINLQANYPESNPDYRFEALPRSDRPCSFSYDGKIYQVQLGFATSPGEFLSYDKGLNPTTGEAIWGAILGAYCFKKQKDFSGDLGFSGDLVERP